ncbi:shugoshin [Trichoderma arundinaceum]|uniref:Shugoshin n=1 Tax=Trichoderma arundinaceum TaxID=490622 RepID=A0A395NWB5_TRIAR|nr:shugoshin [Trichoderma arundinaceum]
MPAPTESLETLRKKMLRQNRELAKTNNIRALRIRELENECACMLSENLELRGRILELEKQVEDNEARRIADHAMAIKAKLESQLTEWGTLIAELGLEPPAKRHSPMVRRRSKQTASFSASRPSPSQRRLRDIARDIEDLGHIAENKSYPRRSMNPEQILALRSEADISVESPELGPPPMSKYIEEDPIKIDSPSRSRPLKLNDDNSDSSQKTRSLEPPVALESSKPEVQNRVIPPSKVGEGEEEHKAPIVPRRGRPCKPKNIVGNVPVQPLKAGSKRKFGARDDDENIQPQRVTNENSLGRILADKGLLHDKADARSVKDFAKLKKTSQLELSESARKPLAAKSTNDDISSPKKSSKMKSSIADDIVTAKVNAAKSKAMLERHVARAKEPSSIEAKGTPLTIKPQEKSNAMRDLAAPIRESALFSPISPAVNESLEGSRGDTPPPTDISSSGETSRPGRRNRTTISYAEPNLRAKMRRPTKELFDAVAGEGKYARRASNCDPALPESANNKREMDIPAEFDNVSDSPLATKNPAADILLSSVVTERRKRSSSITTKGIEFAKDDSMDMETTESAKDASISFDSSGLAENDVYEFTSESPPPEKDEIKEPKKRGRRRTTTSRQSAMAIDEDDCMSARERNNSRRRSMMV